MRFVLQRIYQGDDCTLGVLQSNDGLMCYTLEHPWRDNAPLVSSIPAKEYNVTPYSSEKFPNTWELKSVVGRTSILIHSGNTVDDTKGCILIGSGIGNIKGKKAVLESRITMDKLRAYLGGKSFSLMVRNLV